MKHKLLYSVAFTALCLTFTGCGVNAPPNPGLAQAKADAAKAHAEALRFIETEQKTLVQLNKAIAFLERAHEAPTEAAVKALLTRANESAVQGGIPPLVTEATPEEQPAGGATIEEVPDDLVDAPKAPTQAKVEPISTQQPVVTEEPLEILYEPAPTPAPQRVTKPPVPQPQRVAKAPVPVKTVVHVAKDSKGGQPTCSDRGEACVDAWLVYWAPNNGVKAVSHHTTRALRRKESFLPNLFARGGGGEYGPMQVMEATALGEGVKLPYLNTVAGNTLAGTRVWAKCERLNPGPSTAPAIIRKRAACYNGGQGSVLDGHHLIASSDVYDYATKLLRILKQLA